MSLEQRSPRLEQNSPAQAVVAGPVFNTAQRGANSTIALQQLPTKQVDGGQSAPKHEHGQTQKHLELKSSADEASGSKERPTLMTLPRELRDVIYQYAFTQRVKINEERQNPTICGPGLLCVSRQVYVEALQLYYENTTFFSRNPLDVYFWITKSENRFSQWLKEIHLEHEAVNADPASFESHQFVNMRNILMRECACIVGEGVLKTVYYTAEGRLEMSTGGEFP